MIGFWVASWFFFGPRLRLGHVLVRVTTCVKNREISGFKCGSGMWYSQENWCKETKAVPLLKSVHNLCIICSVCICSVCLSVPCSCWQYIWPCIGSASTESHAMAAGRRHRNMSHPMNDPCPLPRRINASVKRAGAVTLHEPNGSYFTTDQQVKLKCVICCCSASGHDAKRLGNGLEKPGKFCTPWCEKWLLSGLLIEWLHCHCGIALVWVDDAIKIQLLWRNVVQF